MGLGLGNISDKNIFLGSSQVKRIYEGTDKVYQGFGPASEQEFIEQEATGGPAKLLKVYGKSILNNQLVPARSETLTAGGTTAVYTLDGKITITGSTASSVAYSLFISVPLVEGHKYYLAGCPAGGSNSSFSLRYNRNGFGENGNGKIVTYSTSQGASNYMNREPFVVIVNYTITGSLVFRPRLIDLTLRFGAGHEPTSVDEALRLLGGDAFSPTYDPGSLQSNKTAELRAERIPVINVWDEEWRRGYYDVNGIYVPAPTGNYISSSNSISVSPSTAYFVKHPLTVFLVIEKDANGNVLSRYKPTEFATYDSSITTSANTRFIEFCVGSAAFPITTYNHDICINLSDPAINGTYYPHWRGSLSLNLSTLTGKLNGEGASVVVFPDGLRGVGTDRDKAYGSTGEVARAVVDLGTLNWSYHAVSSSYPYGFFSTSLADYTKTDDTFLLTAKYSFVRGGWTVDKTIRGGDNGSHSVYIIDSAYTDPAAFKAAMSGVMLDYPLATPLTYTLDTPLPTDLTCVQGDILQRVSDNNCPFVGEMRYAL